MWDLIYVRYDGLIEHNGLVDDPPGDMHLPSWEPLIDTDEVKVWQWTRRQVSGFVHWVICVKEGA